MYKKIILAIIIATLSLNLANADYKRNINDEIKVYKIEKKVEKILNKYSVEQQKKVKKVVKRKIEKILGMSKNEIWKIDMISNKIFNSLKQYILLKIYRQLTYWMIYWWIPKIVENNFVKAIAFDSNNLKNFSTDTAFYTSYDNWWQIVKMMEFFYINDWLDVEKYLKNKFIPNKYKNKCKVFSSLKKWRKIYTVETFWKYKKELRDWPWSNIWECGIYWVFEKKSKNVLFLNLSIMDAFWIDPATIEVKEKINLTKDKIIKDFWNGLIVRERWEKAFLYFWKKLIYISDLMWGVWWSSTIKKVEKWKNGVYVFETWAWFHSSLVIINNNWQSRNIYVTDWQSDLNENLYDFKLMTNKRVKLFLEKDDWKKSIKIEKIIKIK